MYGKDGARPGDPGGRPIEANRERAENFFAKGACFPRAPDGRAKFFFSTRDRRGSDLSWCWKR